MTASFSRRTVLKGAAAFTVLSFAAPSTAGTAAPQSLSLKRGVNTWPWFSLTREYPAPRTDYAWPPYQTQRPVPTALDLRHLRRAGLDFIRLPVDPGPFLAADRSERKVLLQSLVDAVEMAHDAGLSVVVNVQANGATHYWTPDRMIGGADAPEFAAYRDLVGDIARHLGRMPANKVALEPVNEPPQACASDAWFDIQKQLLAAARAVAPRLTLIATGGCGSMIPGLAALDPASLSAFEPLFFTFHFYEPYLFSHQGAPWMREPVYRALNDVPWPASAGSLEKTLASVRARMEADPERSDDEKQAAYAETEKVLKVYFDAQPDRRFVDHYLDMMSDWARSHGLSPDRVMMGEFGALRTDSRYVAAPAPDRARYVQDVRESAEAHGFSWAFWNMFDGMGVVDDATRVFDPAIVAALGLTMPDG